MRKAEEAEEDGELTSFSSTPYTSRSCARTTGIRFAHGFHALYHSTPTEPARECSTVLAKANAGTFRMPYMRNVLVVFTQYARAV